MRYIRTKDGIYDLDKSIWYEFTGRKVRMPYCEEYEKQPGLCKTVETIEELCDEFVLDHPLFGDNCKCLYHSFEKAKNGIKKRSDNAHNLYDFIIYGAIWTDKGLIYVAKMNKEGELKWHQNLH